MSNLYINTAQNIRLFFTPASVGERMLAFLIDVVIKIAFGILFYISWIFISKYYWMSTFFVVIIYGLPLVLYSLVCEATMGGQTIGKWFMKIRVLKTDGYQAHFMDYLIRWVFSIFDVGLSCIPGLVSILVDKHGRRLGDLAAGTAVVSEKAKYDLSHTILMDVDNKYVPTFAQSQVMLFSDRDIRIIKENLDIVYLQNNRRLAAKLAQKVLAVMQATNPFKSELQLIRTVLTDYDHYTGNT